MAAVTLSVDTPHEAEEVSELVELAKSVAAEAGFEVEGASFWSLNIELVPAKEGDESPELLRTLLRRRGLHRVYGFAAHGE